MLLGISLEAITGIDVAALEPAALASEVLPALKELPFQALEVPLEPATPYSQLFTVEALTLARRAAADQGVGFSVHLPFRGLDLSSEDEAERRRSTDTIKRAIELGSALEPFSYVLHLLPEKRGREEMFFREIAAEKLPEELLDRTAVSLKEILAVVEPFRLCIENLRGNPFPQQASLAISLGASLCLDVGHAIVQGINPAHMFEEYARQIREVHLHDVHRNYEPGVGYVREDHQALGTGILALDEFITALRFRAFDGLLTLEVFQRERIQPSLARLLPLLPP